MLTHRLTAVIYAATAFTVTNNRTLAWRRLCKLALQHFLPAAVVCRPGQYVKSTCKMKYTMQVMKDSRTWVRLTAER